MGTSGQESSGHGFSNGVPDWGRRCAGNSAARSAGRSCANTSAGSKGSGKTWPVFAHQSPGDSPGHGAIAATRTSKDTSSRPQTSGAVNPPSDCATTMTALAPTAPPTASTTASTTASAYSASPARSSSQGRSTAITSWPSDVNRGTDEMPVPRVTAGTVDQHIRGHE